GYAAQTLEGAQNQIRAGLGEYLNGDVVRDEALLDQLAHEVEVGLRGGREADLDFLEADAHEVLEHAALARGIHRLDQCLVAVTQVDTAPGWRSGDRARRPGAVGNRDRSKRSVLLRGRALHGYLLEGTSQGIGAMPQAAPGKRDPGSVREFSWGLRSCQRRPLARG